jgi:hypothetical protein
MSCDAGERSGSIQLTLAAGLPFAQRMPEHHEARVDLYVDSLLARRSRR